MTTINLRENRQAIDYMARDYNSFRQALVDLIPAKIPEWTDRSEADFGIALIELFSYMADILSYYQDRVANESFLSTAQERGSIIEHLKLIGYEMAPAAAAAATLSVIVSNNVNALIEVRKGDQFATPSSTARKSVTFEYTGDKPLLLDTSMAVHDSARKPDGSPLKGFKELPDVIPLREGKSIVNEVVGVSSGLPNQRFRLSQSRLLRNSLQVIVETPVPTPPWRLRKNLILGRRAFTPEELSALEYQERIGSTLAFSRGVEPDYAIETDEDEFTEIVFGDGQYGQIPETNARVLASYRVGGGDSGNVAAGQIKNIAKAPQLQLLGAKVVNRAPASGGAERESIAQAIKFAPSVFSSMGRAVTAEDYVAQAKLFPGVSKARADATNWNVVKLYIAPTGSGEQPSDILKQDLLAYFEDKRMLSTFIQIESPDYVQLEITAEIGVLPYFIKEKVQSDAERAVQSIFEFAAVDFKQIVYLSKIYEALESIDGVDFVFISKFHRSDDPQNIPPEGRIVMQVNEIPVLQPEDLSVEVTGGV
ncbi:MAG: baseplate J/gp47 family protein [Pyrinomonadaceae bacterium]